MKVAIVTSFNYHLECVGFLMELLKDDSVHVYYNKDSFGYLEFFNTLYSFESMPLGTFDELKYDKIIKLSSDDPIKFNDKTKLTSLLHLEKLKKNEKKFITISEIVKSNEEYKYIFPYYNAGNKGNFFSKCIIFIGVFLDEMYNKDLVNFIIGTNYNFIFAVPFETKYTKKIEKIKKVKIKVGLSASELMNTLSEVTFIMVRNYEPFNDRFSGAISIGIANKIPIICTKELIDKVPAIVYNKKYSEIISTVNNFTENDYVNEKNRINNFILTLESNDIHSYL